MTQEFLISGLGVLDVMWTLLVTWSPRAKMLGSVFLWVHKDETMQGIHTLCLLETAFPVTKESFIINRQTHLIAKALKNVIVQCSQEERDTIWWTQSVASVPVVKMGRTSLSGKITAYKKNTRKRIAEKGMRKYTSANY